MLLFLSAAIPFSMLGALSFASLPTALVARIVGVAILLFVALASAAMSDAVQHYFGSGAHTDQALAK